MYLGHPKILAQECRFLCTVLIFYFNYTSNTFHIHLLIHMYIKGFKFNRDGSLWLFFMMFYYAFVGSLLIRFLLQRTTFHCFMCYHSPFQHAQMGKLYTYITQPVLSKGWHCNNMQLLHRDTSINYRKYFFITFTETHYIQINKTLYGDWPVWSGGYMITNPISDHSHHSLILKPRK